MDARSDSDPNAGRASSQAAALLKVQGESLASQNEAAEVKIRAERLLGESLAKMDKQKPGEYQRSHDVTVVPSLSDIGINKMQSHRWQLMASVPVRRVARARVNRDKRRGTINPESRLPARRRAFLLREGKGSLWSKGPRHTCSEMPGVSDTR